mmetsp:Transcript_31318/g.38270  ORF Transcript_31318/g.38270 Transcript_31318/m.38270 type:complete len:199 (+) Transcript_31318:90-686(+)
MSASFQNTFHSNPLSIAQNEKTTTRFLSYSMDLAFPEKLYAMLTHLEENGLESIASWNLDGQAFTINNVQSFMKQIIPIYFNQTRFRSFDRQLNKYGFTRIKSQKNHTYCHNFFLRDNPSLIQKIRIKVKASNETKSTNKPTTLPKADGISLFEPKIKVATSSRDSKNTLENDDKDYQSILNTLRNGYVDEATVNKNR